MSRTTAEWIADHDDQMPPPRVRLRMWQRADGHCQICTRKIMAGEEWNADHIVPLADGGENRERNLQVACTFCHGDKTAKEAAGRAIVRRKAKSHANIKSASRPLPGGKRSKWKKKIGGQVVRRFELWEPSNRGDEVYDTSD